jgi:hypothetical protein
MLLQLEPVAHASDSSNPGRGRGYLTLPIFPRARARLRDSGRGAPFFC